MKNYKKIITSLFILFSFSIYSIEKPNFIPSKIGSCHNKRSKEVNQRMMKFEKGPDFEIDMNILREGKFQVFHRIVEGKKLESYQEFMNMTNQDISNDSKFILIKSHFLMNTRENDFFSIQNLRSKEVIHKLYHRTMVDNYINENTVGIVKTLRIGIIGIPFPLTLQIDPEINNEIIQIKTIVSGKKGIKSGKSKTQFQEIYIEGQETPYFLVTGYQLVELDAMMFKHSFIKPFIGSIERTIKENSLREVSIYIDNMREL